MWLDHMCRYHCPIRRQKSFILFTYNGYTIWTMCILFTCVRTIRVDLQFVSFFASIRLRFVRSADYYHRIHGNCFLCDNHKTKLSNGFLIFNRMLRIHLFNTQKTTFFYRKSARHFSVVWVCVYWSVPVSQNNRTKAKQCSRNLRLETKSMAKQSRQLSVHSYQRDRLADQSQFDANDRTHLSNWKG